MSKRRTMLFVPGNNPGMLQSAPVLGADAIILDLEDAVAAAEKDAARILVRNALSSLDTLGRETVVRVNALDTPSWRKDIAVSVGAGVHAVLLAKCNAPEDVLMAAEAMAQAEKDSGRPQGDAGLILLLESALGVENAFRIASAHGRVEGLFFGAEDFCADMGAQRTRSGEEIAYARARVVLAAKAARVDAIDTPFTAVDDLEGLEQDARLARQMGFDGKAVISPQHVRIVNTVFMPTEREITWATRIKAAMDKGTAQGKGAVSLDGNMVDGPIVKRALGILRAASLLEEE